MEDEIVKVPPEKNRGGPWITFGAEAYRVPPLGLREVREVQDRVAAMGGPGVPSQDQMETGYDVVHAALKRNYPSMTRDQVVDMLDLGNFREVMSAVLGASGFKPREAGASGGALASTGTGSTSP